MPRDISFSILEPSDLKELLLSFYKNAIPENRQEGLAMLSLACHILINALGANWTKNNLFSGLEINGYLLRPMVSFGGWDDLRINRLADNLYALKNVKNFPAFLRELRTRDAEGAELELIIARRIYEKNNLVEFKIPNGPQGENFDLIARKEDAQIAVEIKHILDRKQDFEPKKFKNMLNDKRKQLPRNMPGVIFVKIPDRWAFQPEAKENYSNAIDEFFWGTKRINCVTLVWDEWLEPISSRISKQGTKYHSFLHLKPNIFIPNIKDFYISKEAPVEFPSFWKDI